MTYKKMMALGACLLLGTYSHASDASGKPDCENGGSLKPVTKVIIGAASGAVYEELSASSKPSVGSVGLAVGSSVVKSTLEMLDDDQKPKIVEDGSSKPAVGDKPDIGDKPSKPQKPSFF